ncbi:MULTISPECIES: WG repeat-containing protein [unclassified Myroides]|uniref:WG repeat-containing protein n=1 Tax=unclassified Myroides TaxID=2642485 RepID=UPI0031016B0D
MKKTIAISLFLALYCTNSWAVKKSSINYEYLVENTFKTDTIFIDLKNDPDFKFKKGLRWYQDPELELFGIKNAQDEIYIEPLFYQIESFIDGVSIVTTDDFQGAINDKGEVIIPFSYEELQTSSEFKIAYVDIDKWGFFNTKGEKVINAEYDFVGSFSDGLALASKNNLFGYINHQGKTVIPFQYDYASNFEDGEARVEIKFRSFVINKKGIKIAD